MSLLATADVTAILEETNAVMFGIWFLIGAALVFFMQCGFAMVETGFTRAKNAGNIIMKNLMDFCIGTVVFTLLGFSVMMSEEYIGGLIGVPNLSIFSNFGEFVSSGTASSFVFNLVFCATTATIVSGAMAERTKFSAYCIYSGVISLIIYPIEAGWIWNSQGWLCKLGFIDFAGSCAIHMVGGIAALVGAIILGPRIGKYVKDKSGKVVKVNAIPGHSLTLGALGCFILWFGWYGFNGAAATDGAQLASIFLTTTIAPAVATCTCMVYTWIKNGKPDVSMCLNASLAGLVGITAGCNNVDALGAAIIGIVAGILVVVVVELLDLKLHVDDPVGAVGVHCANGVWGTLAAGLLATNTAPGGVDGPIYALVHGTSFSAGLKVFGVQALGVVVVAVYTVVTMTITFQLIKKFHGLRATAEEEITGLDKTEHGLPSAYADFAPVEFMGSFEPVSAEEKGVVAPSKAVKVAVDPEALGGKISKVDIICKQSKLEELKEALNEIGVLGITVTQVLGCGAQKGMAQFYRGVAVEMNLLPKVKVEVVVASVPVEAVIAAAKKALYTGNYGDGKIFVHGVENVVKIRTGEEGFEALQGEADLTD
ncbi:MAG: ammonium transporter [Eubacterium sp.]